MGLLKPGNAWMGLVPGAFLALFTAVGAARVVVIEDWTTDAVGRRGIPSGWTGEAFGRQAAYDFTIEQYIGHLVLHLKSRNEHSTIARDITGKVNLKETPILEWTWKATILPKGGDLRRKETIDMAAVSPTTPLADYRVRLGRDHPGDNRHKEPEDRDGHVRGDAVGIRRRR